MHDFNHTYLKQRSASDAVGRAIDAALERQHEAGRDYLGASALNGRAFELGSQCLRKIQYNWKEPAPFAPRVKRIFTRGHWAEAFVKNCLRHAEFEIEEGDSFSELDGMFQGHTDGRVTASPIPEIATPCLLEIKGLGDKGWQKLRKEGLKRAYPSYYDQVQLYMAYCELTANAALVLALNCNSMDIEALSISFDSETAQKASDTAYRIVTATKAGELLPRVTDNPEYFSCKHCAYRARCWEGR